MTQSLFSFIFVLHIIAYLHSQYHHSTHFPEQHLKESIFIHATWDFSTTKTVVKCCYIIWLCLWKHPVFIFYAETYKISLHNLIYHVSTLALAAPQKLVSINSNNSWFYATCTSMDKVSGHSVFKCRGFLAKSWLSLSGGLKKKKKKLKHKLQISQTKSVRVVLGLASGDCVEKNSSSSWIRFWQESGQFSWRGIYHICNHWLTKCCRPCSEARWVKGSPLKGKHSFSFFFNHHKQTNKQTVFYLITSYLGLDPRESRG